MQDRETLRHTLKQLLQHETGTSRPELPDSVMLREELGLDSVDLIGLVLQVECELHVNLTGEELARLRCVGDVLDLIQHKLASRQNVAA